MRVKGDKRSTESLLQDSPFTLAYHKTNHLLYSSVILLTWHFDEASEVW